MDRYSILSLLAMVLVPLAPVFFFGHAVYLAVLQLPAPGWVATAVGLAGAVGLELVGILAGHVTNAAWLQQDHGRAVIGAAILITYVAIGVAELWGTIGAIMFLIAPLVYLLAALQDGIKTAVNEQQSDRSFERAEMAKDRALAREIKMEAARAKTAQLAGEKRAGSPARNGQDGGNLPADWRQLTNGQRHHLAHLSRGERADLLGHLADRTRRDWNRKLDEIAAQNGNYKIGENL